MFDKTLHRTIFLIPALALTLVIPLSAQTFTECTDNFGDDARIVDFEGITVTPGQAGAVDLNGDEFPLVFLTAGPGADGLFVGIPDASVPGGNNFNFFAGDFFPVSGVAVFSPDNIPVSSPTGQLIVDFPIPVYGVGGYFLDAEAFPSGIEAFDAPGGTGNSLGWDLVQNKPDDSQVFGSVSAPGILSAVFTLGGTDPGDGVGLDDLCFAAPDSVTLCAGQHIDAGTVTVYNDLDTLFVRFDTIPGWSMSETHVAVACTLEELPQNKSGNPVVGHFPYSMDHDPWLTTYTEAIPLLDCGLDPVLIAAHSVVGETLMPAPYYAAEVFSSFQGPDISGFPIGIGRSNPEAALVPDYLINGLETDFFSLGFGGDIVVIFDCPIVNGEGNDVAVWEVTNGTYPPEKVEVFASQDGVDWTSLGFATNGRALPASSGPSSTQTDLDLGELKWATYIKLVDATAVDIWGGRSNADSFDIDGIGALQACIVDESAWGDACEADGTPAGIGFPGKNWAVYFEYTPEVFN